MKLKEKNALFWVHDNGESLTIKIGTHIPDSDAYKGYLAGFEKAKQLILDEFQECKLHDNYIEMRYTWFENLGEEEV